MKCNLRAAVNALMVEMALVLAAGSALADAYPTSSSP